MQDAGSGPWAPAQMEILSEQAVQALDFGTRRAELTPRSNEWRPLVAQSWSGPSGTFPPPLFSAVEVLQLLGSLSTAVLALLWGSPATRVSAGFSLLQPQFSTSSRLLQLQTYPSWLLPCVCFFFLLLTLVTLCVCAHLCI